MGRRILNPGGLAFLAFAFLLCANLALEPCSVRRGAPHIAPTASAAVSFKDVRYDEGRDSFGTAPEGEKSGDFGSVLGFSVEPLEKVEPGLSPKDARIASALRFRSRGRSLVGGLFAPVVAASAILFLSLACFKSLRGRSHRRRLADRPPGDAPCEQGASGGEGDAPLRVFLQGNEAFLASTSPTSGAFFEPSPAGSSPPLGSPAFQVSPAFSPRSTPSPPPTPTGLPREGFFSPPSSSAAGFEASSTGGASIPSPTFSFTTSSASSPLGTGGDGVRGGAAARPLPPLRPTPRRPFLPFPASRSAFAGGPLRPVPPPLAPGQQPLQFPSAFVSPLRGTSQSLQTAAQSQALGGMGGFVRASGQPSFLGSLLPSALDDMGVALGQLQANLISLEGRISLLENQQQALRESLQTFGLVLARQAAEGRTRLQMEGHGASSGAPPPDEAFQMHVQYSQLLRQMHALQSQVQDILHQHAGDWASTTTMWDPYALASSRQGPGAAAHADSSGVAGFGGTLGLPSLVLGVGSSSAGGEGTEGTSSAATTAASGDDGPSTSKQPLRLASLEGGPRDTASQQRLEARAAERTSPKLSGSLTTPALTSSHGRLQPAPQLPAAFESGERRELDASEGPFYGGMFGKKRLALKKLQERTKKAVSDEEAASSVSGGSSSGVFPLPSSSLSRERRAPYVSESSQSNGSNGGTEKASAVSAESGVPGADSGTARQKRRARPRRRIEYADWGLATRRRRRARSAKTRAEGTGAKSSVAATSEAAEASGLKSQHLRLPTHTGVGLFEPETSQSSRPLIAFFPGSPQKTRWLLRRSRNVVELPSGTTKGETPSRGSKQMERRGTPDAAASGVSTRRRKRAALEAELQTSALQASFPKAQSGWGGERRERSASLSEGEVPFFEARWRSGPGFASASEDSLGEAAVSVEEIQAKVELKVSSRIAGRTPGKGSWENARLFVEKLQSVLSKSASAKQKTVLNINGIPCAILTSIQSMIPGTTNSSLLQLLARKLALYTVEFAVAFEAIPGLGSSSASPELPSIDLEIETTAGIVLMKANFGTDQVESESSSSSSDESSASSTTHQ